MSLFNFVKSALPILDVVRTYVPLKPLGAYWKASCPFHAEKDASFTISPDKGIFYCFGCHASGDVISFVARQEQMSQLEAVHHLVEQYSLTVPEHLMQGAMQASDHAQRERYLVFCTHFAQWCAAQLATHDVALQYVRDRGLNDESCKRFLIGYFPGTQPAFKNLVSLLTSHGFLVADAIAYGVLLEKHGVLTSPFQDRLLFPIFDALGRCCGFGGRIFLPGDTRPKYYNSKDSDAFAKGRILFGFDKAKKAIQTQGYAYLVEGYMDCVAMVQYGYTNTVATLGTACTVEHLRLIARHATRLLVVYDGDQAGQKAMARLAELCWQVDLELAVITLPEGRDPAALLTQGVDLAPFLSNPQDIFSFFVGRTSQAFDQKPLAEKLVAARKILALLAHIQDPLKRDLLLGQASLALGIPKHVLEQGGQAIEQQQVRQTAIQQTYDVHDEVVNTDTVDQLEEKIFCAILAQIIHTKSSPALSSLMPLFSLRLVRLCTALQRFAAWCGSQSGVAGVAQFLDFVEQDDREWVIRVSMEETLVSDSAVLEQLLTLLARSTWKVTARTLKEQLMQAQELKDSDAVLVLMRQFASLKQEMYTRGIL